MKGNDIIKIYCTEIVSKKINFKMAKKLKKENRKKRRKEMILSLGSSSLL